MAGLQTVRVRPPTQGVDTENSPEYVAEAYSPTINNMMARGGRLRTRGRFATSAVFSGLPTPDLNYSVPGLMTFDNQFLAKIDGAGITRHVNLGTGVQTNVVFSIASTRHARVGAYVYGPGSATPGNGISLSRWPGGAVAPTFLATAPVGSVDVVSHLERIFTLGGSIGAAGGISSVMWSDAGGTSAVEVAADWQDNTTGLTNQITVGALDGDSVVAFGKADRSLVIFKRRSMYLLTGQTPSSFQVRRFSGQTGCVSRDSVCSYNEGTYFMSDQGLMWFDGAQLVEVSKPVRAEIQQAVKDTYFSPVATTYPYMTVQDIGFGCLMIAMGDYGSTAGTLAATTTSPKFQYVYDTVRDTWTQFTIGGAVLASSRFKPNAVFWCNSRPVATDGNQFGYVDPLPVTTPVFPQVLDTLIIGGVSTGYQVSAQWYSRLLKLSSPTHKAQLHRIMLDFTYQQGAGLVGENGWLVQLVDGFGTVLYTGNVLATPALVPTGTYRQRAVMDCFAETEDVQVRITASATPMLVAEIYDAMIEYQPAAMRTG